MTKFIVRNANYSDWQEGTSYQIVDPDPWDIEQIACEYFEAHNNNGDFTDEMEVEIKNVETDEIIKATVFAEPDVHYTCKIKRSK